MSLPPKDEFKPTEEQGLFNKFLVTRLDGQSAPGMKHHNCEYFVLDVTHDPYAGQALRSYAAACHGTHPKLAADLLSRHPEQIPPEASFNDEQWWYKELVQAAEASTNMDLKRAVYGVVRNLMSQLQESRMSAELTLTAEEIGDLALASGFSLPPEAYPDEDQLGTEYTIVRMDPTKGVVNDDNVVEHYAHVAYITEYPEEGSFPLGPKRESPRG